MSVLWVRRGFPIQKHHTSLFECVSLSCVVVGLLVSKKTLKRRPTKHDLAVSMTWKGFNQIARLARKMTERSLSGATGVCGCPWRKWWQCRGSCWIGLSSILKGTFYDFISAYIFVFVMLQVNWLLYEVDWRKRAAAVSCPSRFFKELKKELYSRILESRRGQWPRAKSEI